MTFGRNIPGEHNNTGESRIVSIPGQAGFLGQQAHEEEDEGADATHLNHHGEKVHQAVHHSGHAISLAQLVEPIDDAQAWTRIACEKMYITLWTISNVL